jgi:hypothetical protein
MQKSNKIAWSSFANEIIIRGMTGEKQQQLKDPDSFYAAAVILFVCVLRPTQDVMFWIG